MFVAALLLFVEEVLWEAVKRLMALLGRLPLVHALETRIAHLPPYGAALVFLAPGALLLPVKIAALWLIAHGHALLGIETILTAKVVGTALVARIFTLTRPTLMTLAWFATLHDFIMRWRERLYGFVKASHAWQWLSALRQRVRDWLANVGPGRIAQRLKAIRRLRRRAERN